MKFGGQEMNSSFCIYKVELTLSSEILHSSVVFNECTTAMSGATTDVNSVGS